MTASGEDGAGGGAPGDGEGCGGRRDGWAAGDGAGRRTESGPSGGLWPVLAAVEGRPDLRNGDGGTAAGGARGGRGRHGGGGIESGGIVNSRPSPRCGGRKDGDDLGDVSVVTGGVNRRLCGGQGRRS